MDYFARHALTKRKRITNQERGAAHTVGLIWVSYGTIPNRNGIWKDNSVESVGIRQKLSVDDAA